MPIKGNIKDSSFAPQIRLFDNANGSKKLKACINEYVKAIFDIEVYWYAEPQLFDIFDDGGRIVRNDGGNFLDDGFQIGEEIDIRFGFSATGQFSNGAINAISEDGSILFTNINGLTNGSYDETFECLIIGTSILENANYSFGLIENKEPFNTFSKVEGSNQQFYVENIALSAIANAQFSGTIKGWDTQFNSNLSIERLDSTDIPIFRGPNFGGFGGTVESETVLNYRIRHQFPILPYFTAGQLDNLINGIAPSFLAGNNSLKHVFECIFKQNLSDENNNKVVRFENLNGSVGFFGENFNGFSTQYSLESIEYTALPSLLSNPSLLVQGLTRVNAIVNSEDGTFTGTENIVISHSYLPQDEDEYTNSTDFFDTNFVFEAITKGSSGSIVQSVSTSLISSNQLAIEFIVDVSSAKPTLTAESNYLLSVILEDDTTTQEQSDRTAILLDVNNYDLNPDIPGLLEFTSFSNFDHGTDISEIGFSNYKGWIQDGYAVKGGFRLNRDLRALLESFSIQVVAWKDGTDDYFLIQENNFNVSNAIIDSNGNQQIFIDDTQGFKLAQLDQFNQKVLITSNAPYVAPYIEYGFALGIKINWQEWLSLPDADVIFYDVLEPNQGLNQNTSRYSLKEGYTLQTIVKTVVSQDGIDTDYINKSELVVNDFGEIASEDWTMLPIQTFDSAANSLEGSIIPNEYVTIRAEFQPNFVITPVLDDYYGIIRIDRQLSQGNKDIYEMSSVRSIPQDNLLIPLEGESLLKLSLNGNNIVLECRTNKNQIEAIPYNLSARLGGKGVVILGDFNDDFNDDFFT